MSQRDSGYERIPFDNYSTPSWVTATMLQHIPKRLNIWECAAGSGQMAEVLETRHRVTATDIIGIPSVDFLATTKPPARGVNCIFTNPPYTHARQFIEHALNLMQPVNGMVCMLLRTDYDHAKTREHLFAKHQAFSKKLVLTKRIQWFEHATSAPSFNHALFIWDWKHSGPPTIAYGP